CKRADYVQALSTDALRGKRIGVLRFDRPRQAEIVPIYERALQVLREGGAQLVEVATPAMASIYEAESRVLHTEFKIDLNAYLATLPDTVEVRTLGAL
ncbi:hypothetical protein, partial [Salmonella enterica]|uniref:hypothetical protein n=1 Tax=Salmonella enterica TaxID=28901 RepID=UPI0032987A6E